DAADSQRPSLKLQSPNVITGRCTCPESLPDTAACIRRPSWTLRASNVRPDDAAYIQRPFRKLRISSFRPGRCNPPSFPPELCHLPASTFDCSHPTSFPDAASVKRPFHTL